MKEKPAFPIFDVNERDGRYDLVPYKNGISQDYYAAVRIFPDMLKLYEYARTEELSWEETFDQAAKLTWKAVDALNKAKEERDGKDNG